MSRKKIDPVKLQKKLEPYKSTYIIEQANNRFSRQSLSAWKKGHWNPGKKNLSLLLSIINCELDDISISVENSQV